MISLPIDVENIEHIKETVLESFPWNDIHKLNLFYIPDNLSIFLSIEELKSNLEKLGFLNYVRSFAFNVLKPNSNTSIHIDTGESSFSFNLPLFNCENTFTSFYQTDKTPEVRSYVAMNRTISYNYYNPIHCNEIHRIEMNRPHIISIHIPHRVINPNNTYRIAFLIRFKKEFDEYWRSQNFFAPHLGIEPS